jgi:hypothetical protein
MYLVFTLWLIWCGEVAGIRSLIWCPSYSFGCWFVDSPAPLACQSFSSLVALLVPALLHWSGSAPPCHLLQLPGINPLLCCVEWSDGAVWKNCGVLSKLWCWSTGPASPGRVHLLQLLAQLGCCGVASSALSVQWLSCLCAASLCVSLFRSHPLLGRAVKFGLVPKCFVPKFLTEQMLYLIICTQWCKWQFICQSLRILTLILSQFLFVLLCFFCRLYDQDQDIGDGIASLDLVFFYVTLCNFVFSLQYCKDIV